MSAVRACLRRLGESDRAILRPLDQQQESWEISHDFLVPLLDSIVARRTVSLWRRFRPWLPWTAASAMGVMAFAISLMTHENPRTILINQGWNVSQKGDELFLMRATPIPAKSISILRGLPPPIALELKGAGISDVSALKELKSLTNLDLRATKVSDVSALKELKNLEIVK
jgi:hypothetical protein